MINDKKCRSTSIRVERRDKQVKTDSHVDRQPFRATTVPYMASLNLVSLVLALYGILPMIESKHSLGKSCLFLVTEPAIVIWGPRTMI
jgi:hypothetical protein